MSNNLELRSARRAKKDEFYTQLTDIEKELIHYRQYFKDKVIYCNCDDPYVSNFFRYFSSQYEILGLKKLITTCYKSQDMFSFSKNDSETAISLEYDGYREGERVPKVDDIGVHHLASDGDFRSAECLELLKQADIVSTNPPFSLFREYVAQLMEHNKKFIIIGNINAVSYKEIFSWIKANRMWLGVSINSGDREFGIPADYPLEAAGFRTDERGNKFIRVKGVRWFTNLDVPKRHEKLILYENYNPKKYPKYDNYDAINIDKTAEIPKDYDGVMGVPLTFLDKYNPEQFEIVGQTHKADRSKEVESLHTDPKNRHDGIVAGKKKYMRVLLRMR